MLKQQMIHVLLLGALTKGLSISALLTEVLLAPRVQRITSCTSSLLYLEKVFYFGGSILPPITVVGKATLSEKALYLAVWAIATMFREFYVKDRCWYFCQSALEFAYLSVKFMLFATKGFLGGFGGWLKERDISELDDLILSYFLATQLGLASSSASISAEMVSVFLSPSSCI